MPKIKNKHTKPGYKKTKLGWIPRDWDCSQLNKVFKLTSGNTKPQSFNESKTEEYPFPVYGGNGIMGYTNEYFVENKVLVIGRVGEYCGSARLINEKCWITDNALYTKQITDTFSEKFLLYLLQKFDFRRLRNKGGQPLISQKPIYLLIICHPLKPEQQKIAQILSTWDRAIEIQTKLIKKYVLRKKRLMQQLLTGKKRFEGFENEWNAMKFSDFLKPISRQVDKPKEEYLSIGIRSHGKGTFQKRDFDPEKIQLEKLFVVKKDDLIVNITFAWEGAIAIVKNIDDGALVSHRFPTFTFETKKMCVNYFRHIIKQPRFVYLMKVISPGGAGRNRVLSQKDFLQLKLSFPSTKEQQKIADVLEAADNEIKAMKETLEKLKEQKKGLMQQLLTGKTRVKVKEEK